MVKKVKRCDNKYCFYIKYCGYGYYIEIDATYFKIDGFEALYYELHDRYNINPEEKGYFKNLDDAEKYVEELVTCMNE